MELMAPGLPNSMSPTTYNGTIHPKDSTQISLEFNNPMDSSISKPMKITTTADETEGLPVELIDHIVDLVAEAGDFRTLIACGRTDIRNSIRCRTYLFSSVRLESLTGHNGCWTHSLEMFSAKVEANPSLGSHVRDLQLYFSKDCFLPENELLRVLESIKVVSSFAFGSRFSDEVDDDGNDIVCFRKEWGNFPAYVPTAIYRFLKVNGGTLRSLRLESIGGIPFHRLELPSTLKSLYLRDCSGTTLFRNFGPPSQSKARLEHLRLTTDGIDITFMHLDNIIEFEDLKFLEVELLPDCVQSAEFMQAVLANATNIEYLSAYFSKLDSSDLEYSIFPRGDFELEGHKFESLKFISIVVVMFPEDYDSDDDSDDERHDERDEEDEDENDYDVGRMNGDDVRGDEQTDSDGDAQDGPEEPTFQPFVGIEKELAYLSGSSSLEEISFALRFDPQNRIIDMSPSSWNVLEQCLGSEIAFPGLTRLNFLIEIEATSHNRLEDEFVDKIKKLLNRSLAWARERGLKVETYVGVILLDD